MSSTSRCTALAALLLVACSDPADGGGAPGGNDNQGGDEPTTSTGGGGGGVLESGGGGAAPLDGGGGAGGAEVCLDVTEPCDATEQCCTGVCGNTSLGQVCCGETGASCATANGEDCCGDLLCVAGHCLPSGAYPLFQAPYPCDESWTYSHHSQEVRRALDFIDEAGNTNGAPALAAAQGVATQHYEAGGAGNYISIEHGGGWRTYYFHLQSFTVADGTFVTQGQEVGRVGSTGASSGPHLHFEELHNGEGKDIYLDGMSLAPYPGEYFEQSHKSNNCPP